MGHDMKTASPIDTLLDRVAGLDTAGGNPRLKQILRKVVGDLYATIDAFDVTDNEFWHILHFLSQGAPEFGLWAAGLGFEHYLDLRADAAERASGLAGGTPRTIEGPLYIAGAPLSIFEARLDDGTESGEALLMEGHVRDSGGAPIAGAIVDVWHANTLGHYSHFDPGQPAFNYRRRITTDDGGRYRFRSLMPSGYAVPTGGSTEKLLDAVGRHGRRPAHIHFFISAPGHRHLTTQINIDGDPDLHDDFAYATRDGLIPPVQHKHASDESILGLSGDFAYIAFDFMLPQARELAEAEPSSRPRMAA